MQSLHPMQPGESIPHERTCSMHKDERIKVCWGRLKKGQPCTNKAVPSGNLDEVPTCGVHRRLTRKSASCVATLSCGFQCKKTCLFRVHGFQLCSLHEDNSTACYFMKIPIELRQRIYGYLLPAKPIQARKSERGSVHLVWLEILRANRQIHEEGIQLLYGTGSFVIEICKDGLSMCHSPAVRQTYKPPPRFLGPPSGIGNHALQDYQLQLMLLEQQNKKRLMLGRQQLEANGESSQQVRKQPSSVNGMMSSPPPLSPNHFSMIRSFVIDIRLDDTQIWAQQFSRYYNPDEPIVPEVLEKALFEYCDHLHKLVSRLQLQQLSRLHIKIRFGGTYYTREKALGAAQLLLEPFRRLRNIAQADVLSATVQAPGEDELEFLPILSKYIHYWSLDLKSSRPPDYSPVFEAYWQLEDMVKTLRNYYRPDLRLDQLPDYLHGARVAREANDMETFGVIWGQVVNIHMDYLNSQKEFQTNMAMTIDRINSLLAGEYD
ncbi:hypothetical protein BKA65DRAFT_224957 [Rhexocercosporidium sp. MPI-PUGE-AT-0058]|nr:hypothetical protein BKA65DRAFT_224957 [Rhexocercosporidium sp. MPI-PUGE-AT-0058]